MSVQHNTYVIYGINVPYDVISDRYDEFEDYFDSPYDAEYPNPLILFDGMGGKYAILGMCAEKSEVYQGLYTAVDLKGFGAFEKDAERKIEAFVERMNLPIEAFSWKIITHYR